MIRTLDNLATRYHMLPSEALSRATTFDLEVLNTSTLWENHQYRKQNNVPDAKPEPTQDQMLAMVHSVKERKQ